MLNISAITKYNNTKYNKLRMLIIKGHKNLLAFQDNIQPFFTLLTKKII